MLRERGSAVLNNPEATAGLKLELAIADSIGRPLCQSTYMLEGGGPLMLIAYDIRDFCFLFSLTEWSSCHSVVYISPAWDYLNNVVRVKLEPFLKMFRVAALINPFYVRDIKPSRDVYFELITSLNYFDAETVAAMMGVIDLYNIFITLLPHGLPRDRFDTRVDDMKEHYLLRLCRCIIF